MTDEQLDTLEQKWSHEFGGQEVCDLIREVRRMREWIEGIRDFAGRAVPHAMGPGHAALTNVLNATGLALDGAMESDYHYRNIEVESAELLVRQFLVLPCQQCAKDGLSTCQHPDSRVTLQVGTEEAP